VNVAQGGLRSNFEDGRKLNRTVVFD
jgi:hypothetical protein